MAALPRVGGCRYAGLVMNRRGLDRAVAAGVDEINVVVVATDTFCLRNQGVTTAEACGQAALVAGRARPASRRLTIGAAFGCPFEGEVPARSRGRARVADAGPDELALADTIGVAVPTDVMPGSVAAEVPAAPRAVHFHDTRHTGVANAVAAVAAGVRTLDASIGGIGGCPFAPGATGNVATEDLVYLFDRMGVTPGSTWRPH